MKRLNWLISTVSKSIMLFVFLLVQQPPYEKVNDDKIDGPLTFPLLERYIAGTSTVNSADVVVLMTA